MAARSFDARIDAPAPERPTTAMCSPDRTTSVSGRSVGSPCSVYAAGTYSTRDSVPRSGQRSGGKSHAACTRPACSSDSSPRAVYSSMRSTDANWASARVASVRGRAQPRDQRITRDGQIAGRSRVRASRRLQLTRYLASAVSVRAYVRERPESPILAFSRVATQRRETHRRMAAPCDRRESNRVY